MTPEMMTLVMGRFDRLDTNLDKVHDRITEHKKDTAAVAKTVTQHSVLFKLAGWVIGPSGLALVVAWLAW